MPVYSMTGYASAQRASTAGPEPSSTPPARLGLEIRSVNSRFLDLALRLPDELRALEPSLRSLLTAQLKRGKVELRAAIEHHEAGALPSPTPRLLQRINTLQDNVQAWLPQAAGLSVADVLRLCAGSQSHDSQDWSTIALELAQQVLHELRAARAREGERLSAMLLERVAQLRSLAEQASPLVPQVVAQQRQRFLERWREAMELADGHLPPEASQERALAEATAFAIRIDVAEEVTRLQSHLDEIERLLHKGDEVGKRLDFLIQELHREANTMGSKSAALDLTRISVDMKVLIEQMREQVQNLE